MIETGWVHIGAGLLGILLILNAVLAVCSNKYFSFLQRVFFIEPTSSEARERFKNYLNKEQKAQRYLLSAVMFLLGIIAVAWMFGINLTYF